ncbi:MAG: hypothetical protein ACI8ZB_001132 [Desulforhopalus sp.]|jgi:hypothetical protein
MRLLLTITMMLLLTSCSTIDMKRYTDNAPQLDLYSYFTGNTRGWGIVQDRKGVLTRQFVVDITGEINGNGQLVLRETFDWNDGEKSSRTWVLSQQDKHNFSGTAGDVIDQAEGILYGNVLNWQYQLNLKVDDATWKIAFDDWMFLVSEEILLNKATMSKFGFKVGEVTIVFRK